ncbi:MAG: nucleotidyltransferase family protein [Candidatus Aminicenantaceae bacterium]
MPLPATTPMINKLIVLCSRLNFSPQDSSKIEYLLESDSNWEQIIKKAAKEGVAPLLYHNLKKYRGEIPVFAMEQLKRKYQISTARNTYIYKNLKAPLQAIKDSNLRVAITKGTRLAVTLYQDIGLRPFMDVDLIAHFSDWQNLREILKDLSFTHNPYGEYISKHDQERYDWTCYNYFRKDNLLIDIHFDPFDLRLPAKNIEKFWESARKENISGIESYVFSPEYEFCKLCVHTQKHSYHPLIWLTDIAEFSSRGGLDWNQTLRICREEEIFAPVYYGLHIVNRLWPGTFSNNTINTFKVGILKQKLLEFFWPEEKVLSRNTSLKVPFHTPTIFPLLSRKRILFKLKTLFHIFFPHQDWVAHFYEIPPNSIKMLLHYAGRFLRLISVFSKFLFRIKGNL